MIFSLFVWQIQKNTGTRINFKEDGRSKEDDSTRTMIIRGTAESAQRAELVIRDFVANMPVILTEVMSVPSSALGRIIGRFFSYMYIYILHIGSVISCLSNQLFNIF